MSEFESEREKLFKLRNSQSDIHKMICDECDHDFGDEHCGTVKDRGDDFRPRECDVWSYRVSVLDHDPEQEER